MRLFVANLPYATSELELHDIFSRFAPVESVRIARDRSTQQSKGFGFVEMPDRSAVGNAIAQLDGSEVGGRLIAVKIAR